MQQRKTDTSPMVYYTSGNNKKEWVLFLHAAFVHHAMFRPQIAYFKSRYNLLLPDLIGHGQSIHTKKGDSIHKTADWLADILNAEKIDRIHIAGVSLGAVLAQDFANKYPEKVQSLACFGGYDINHFDRKMQKENSAAQMCMMCKALFSIKWFSNANKKISAATLQAQEDFYAMNLQFPKKSFRYLASLGSLVNHHETKQRNYPLLIGCGELDSPLAQKAVNQWKEKEPDLQSIIFPHAGHCVNMDVPQAFNQTMEEFWAGAAASPIQDLDPSIVKY